MSCLRNLMLFRPISTGSLVPYMSCPNHLKFFQPISTISLVPLYVSPSHLKFSQSINMISLHPLYVMPASTAHSTYIRKLTSLQKTPAPHLSPPNLHDNGAVIVGAVDSGRGGFQALQQFLMRMSIGIIRPAGNHCHIRLHIA